MTGLPHQLLADTLAIVMTEGTLRSRSSGCTGSWRTDLVFFVASCTVTFPVDALGDDAADAQRTAAGHHRLEFSYSGVEVIEGDADLFIGGYTFTVTKSFRMGLAIGYYDIDPDDSFVGPEAENLSGWGDAQLVLQWDPGEQITSSPWVPNRLGAYSIITAPTSNAEFATRQWEIEIGFGAPAWEAKHFAFLPSGYVRTTFEERDPENKDREIGVVPGLYWVVNEQLWVGYAPTIAYNTTFDTWAYDHSLTAGWLFRSGLGIGFSIERTDRIDPGASGDAYTGLLNFYFVFGEPH